MMKLFRNLFKHTGQLLLARLNLLLLGNKNAFSFKHPIDAEAEESKLQTEWKRQALEDEYL